MTNYNIRRCKKRGQAALEFLTTYGWAILIVLVMIGAISYFGILNPAKLFPEKCSFSTEISCKDYQIKSDGDVNLLLRHNIGRTIFLDSVKCEYEGASVDGTLSSGEAINNNAWSPRLPLSFKCNFGAATFSGLKGEKVKVNIYINYKKSDDTDAFIHELSGEVFAAIN